MLLTASFLNVLFLRLRVTRNALQFPLLLLLLLLLLFLRLRVTQNALQLPFLFSSLSPSSQWFWMD